MGKTVRKMKFAHVKELFYPYGVDSVGACRFDAVKDRLIKNGAKRKVPVDAAYVIMAAFPYKTGVVPLNISCYAAVPDYHPICGHILEAVSHQMNKQNPGGQTAWFVDHSPLPEVYTAALGGMGMIGDNGLLITPKYGSYVFLGGIVTNILLDGCPHLKEPPHCIRCGLCRKACIGGALSGNGFDKNNCLSHITQKKGELSPLEMDMIKKSGSVWGCDICQKVCPLNKDSENTRIPAFLEDVRDNYQKGEDIRGRAYAWRGRETVERNIKIAEKKRK